MGVVKGDRIAESRRLNSVSVEAQTFYSAFIAAVPDDFGRFRMSAAHVAVRMYPRREPTVKMLRMIGRMLTELEVAGSWSTWEVDGVSFGEVVGWQPTGNLYHRTPEPPATTHGHSRRCATTAIARAEEWGQPQEAERLRLWLNELRTAEAEQKSNRPRTGGGAEVEHPSPPSPPSPPSLGTDTDYGLPASPAPSPEPPASAEPPNGNGAGKATPLALAKPAAPWSKDAATDWDSRFGVGSCNAGRIGKALSPLVKAHGWGKVRPAWLRYLREKEPDFLTPQDFASKFGFWSGDAAPAQVQGRQTKGQELAAMAARFIARGES